ncbi:NAD(P)/FAD-dependent oxidoreductase [Paenibacillus agilis]|uniref:NADH:ubiquinone reductase (non-electrogenic) n=1 Tax=Paenibacillus agilis TaxID=3020863 RepID=A0A559IXS7_9BACL|nr:FAD-dependent oxidoreductase [Paenibacillus agilis]TVX92439.1 pyridine nucleotide-disulfide oxidoreductase [Paenibacillus agilis]
MKELTCVVVGGGFAGIHAIKAIRKAFQEKEVDRKLRLILLDPHPYHVRKVLLFRPAVSNEPITIPWKQILQEDAQFVQGALQHVESDKKWLLYKDEKGQDHRIHYDLLVVAIGSVARQPEPDQGGISLNDIHTAGRMREQWYTNMKLAAAKGEQEQERLLTAAVAGAGITGIETAAELAHAMRKEAVNMGIDPAKVKVHLLNAQERLFMEGPAKASRKLDSTLAEIGVIVHHREKAIREEDGHLILSSGAKLPVGLTIWALGLIANPALRHMTLPLTDDGKIIVDECYRVPSSQGIYAVGDCAHVVDMESGKADQMTCKEAIPQAKRLGKIIWADLTGGQAPQHKGVLDSFSIGLGPDRGLLWTHKWGLDIILTGKLAYKTKKTLWDYVSMV